MTAAPQDDLRHDGSVTGQPTAPGDDRSPLPPDPERFDEYRNVAARKRGLPKPYIAGGDDPEQRHEEQAEQEAEEPADDRPGLRVR